MEKTSGSCTSAVLCGVSVFGEVSVLKDKFLCLILCLTLHLMSVSGLHLKATTHYFMAKPTLNSSSFADFYSMWICYLQLLPLNILNCLVKGVPSGVLSYRVTLDSRTHLLHHWNISCFFWSKNCCLPSAFYKSGYWLKNYANNSNLVIIICKFNKIFT